MSDHDIVGISERIAVLESLLGLNGLYDNNASTLERVSHLPADFSNRIDGLQYEIDSIFSSNDTLQTTTLLQSELTSCENLAKSLDPSGLLLACSYNPSNISQGPFIYRRQEILARWEDLQFAFHTLAEIRDLILRSYPQLTKALQELKQRQQSVSSLSSTVNIQQLIVSAPIISSSTYEYASDSTNLDRLDSVTQIFSELQDRLQHLTKKADDLIDRYYYIMSLINDKFTLAIEEDLNQKSAASRRRSS